MDLRWENHLLSPWHPGVLAAVIGGSILAWYIGASTIRLMFRVDDPWRRVVYLTLPACLVAAFVFLLPQLLFNLGWLFTHPRHVRADLFAARYVLNVPLLVAVCSAIRQIGRTRQARAGDGATVV